PVPSWGGSPAEHAATTQMATRALDQAKKRIANQASTALSRTPVAAGPNGTGQLFDRSANAFPATQKLRARRSHCRDRGRERPCTQVEPQLVLRIFGLLQRTCLP